MSFQYNSVSFIHLNLCVSSITEIDTHLAWSGLYLLFPSNCFETNQSQIYPKLRPTGTPVRLKKPDCLGLKTQTLPDLSLKNARWALKAR